MKIFSQKYYIEFFKNIIFLSKTLLINNRDHTSEIISRRRVNSHI